MRSKLALCAVLAAASVAYGKDSKSYQTGKFLQMDSVQCGTAEKGRDSGDKKTQELLCQEYVLQAEKVTYRIRPRDEKHAALLPIGEQAQFRLQKNKMLVRVENAESGSLGKEREYVVVSMTPRTDSTAADATPSQLNHLQ